MKNLNAVLMIATLFSLSAFAGEHTINAVGRAGLAYKNNDVKKTGTPSSSSFNFDYLRTTFAGSVTPSVKYLLTTDFLAANGTTDSVDGTSAFIDEAYLTKSFLTSTSLIFGKKAVLVGGREYDYLNFDRYSLSGFFNQTPANQVGVTLNHEIAGQTFMLQYFNGNKTNGTTSNAQSKFGYSVGWYGNIMDGMIKPIVAYTVVPEAALATTSTGSADRVNAGSDNFLSAGLQFNLPMGLIIEADYDLLTEADAAGTATDKKDYKITSIVGLIKYSTDSFSPFVKVISDTTKLDTTKTASKMVYDLGLEYKESKDDMIRYHVVYSGSTVKTGINTTEVKSSPSSILVGLKFDAAILK
jgi:hypothetical protein